MPCWNHMKWCGHSLMMQFFHRILTWRAVQKYSKFSSYGYSFSHAFSNNFGVTFSHENTNTSFIDYVMVSSCCWKYDLKSNISDDKVWHFRDMFSSNCIVFVFRSLLLYWQYTQKFLYWKSALQSVLSQILIQHTQNTAKNIWVTSSTF